MRRCARPPVQFVPYWRTTRLMRELSSRMHYVLLCQRVSCWMCFIFSPFLNFKMHGVPIGGISGKKFAPQFSIMTSYWGGPWRLKFLGSEIAWYGHISRTAHRRSTKLVSKCAEESISYTRCRATYTLSASEKKLFQKKEFYTYFWSNEVIQLKIFFFPLLSLLLRNKSDYVH